MSESVIDFAGLDSAAAAVTTPAADSATTDSAVVDTPTTDGTETKVEGTEEAAADSAKAGTEEKNADGTSTTKAEELPGDKTTPENLRKLLKAMKDADPNNAAAVKELHGAFERYNAYAKEFATVQDARDAKAFLELMGGPEGYEKLNNTVESINESDKLLYAGDPALLDNIIEDLKSEGKIDAFGKLAGPFLDKLKGLDKDAYYDTFQPHFLAGLKEVNMPGAIAGIMEALNDADPARAVEAAKKIAGGMSDWYKGLEAQSKPKVDPLSPERKKFDEERAAFQKQQEEFKTNQTKEFQTNVAKECEKSNNTLLGKELGPYIKMPFFKSFSRENFIPLGNTIKADLYEDLKADKAYQAQMKAMWGAKTPDRAKITEYHKAKVEAIADRIVRTAVQKMYPGYAKGGSAAGRVAAVEAKKTAQAKVETAAAASGKPIYVAAKPAWDSIDWDKDPKQHLFIAGKAYLKGSGKLVTWRK